MRHTEHLCPNKALACLRALRKDVELSSQLFSLCPVLLRFPSNVRYEVGGHSRHGDGSEDLPKSTYKLRLDDLDHDIINKSIQCNLSTGV